MPVSYLLSRLWQWIVDPGLTLAVLLVLSLLVPRVARFAQRWLARGVEDSADADESKTRLALTGVTVYIFQLVAFFVLLIFFLQVLGFSLAGAAIPATVVSAAIGFGAQSIIADFLSGFFILTEKQFGVGDWVRFEGNGIQLEGTVIQVTMRATRIRTLAQQTVIIPNSTARVAINNSNYWSRAVVVIPVPLLGSENAQEAIDRSESATRLALRRPDVAAELIGDLDVHPAVDINPPSTVGMPWTVDMRFMIQVKAGSQWLVERAIRSAILDEFWNEYGSATTITGEVTNTVTTKAFNSAPLIDIPLGSESVHDEESTVPEGFEDEKGHDPAVVDPDQATTVMEAAGTVEEATEEEEKPADGSVFRNDDFPSRWKNLSSLGGRVRPSTTYLFAALFVLLIFKGLTVTPGEGWEGRGGILSPSRGDVTTSSSTEPAEPAEPTASVTQEPTDQESFPTEPTTPSQLDLEDTPTGESPEPGEPAAPEPNAPTAPTGIEPPVVPTTPMGTPQATPTPEAETTPTLN